MKGLRIGAAAALLAGILGSPASAQPPLQTPENAQAFIRTIFSHYRPTDDVCVSERPVRTENGAVGNQALRWRDVAEVAHEPGTKEVRVIMTDGNRNVFELAAASTAARLAYAMEFLRQHCDPAAETGF